MVFDFSNPLYRLRGNGGMGVSTTPNTGAEQTMRQIAAPFVGVGAYNQGYVPSMNNYTGAGRPPGSVNALPKSPNVSAALTPAFQTRAANSAKTQQSLTDWTKEFLASRPRAQRFANQEISSIDRAYGSGPGSVESDLAQIRKNRAAAIRDLTESAYRRAGRSDSLRRMMSGNSGYNDRLYAQQMGDIAASTAASDADQQRDDLMYLQSNRQGLAGSRSQILDTLLNRDLTPLTVANQFEGADLNNLGYLQGIEQGNNIYEPAETTASRRLQLLDQLLQMGLIN